MGLTALIVCLSSLVSNHVVADDGASKPTDLDFWVGDWVMDSRQPQDKPSKGEWQKNAATNHVTRVYGSKVIQESFKTTGFTGGSWSSFDPTTKTWHQTWVDDSGAYLLFTGGMKGDEFVLDQTNSKKGQARMRFANITKSGFDWYWESSTDGSQWTLNWHLKYHRKK